MVWSKFKSLFTRTGRFEEKRVDCLDDKLSVNEEYVEAHRTNSYTDMLNRVQVQMGRKSLDRQPSSSSVPFRVHLSESLLEPRQQTLTTMIEGSNLHRLLVEYFEVSFEASNSCELLLRSVHQARANHRIIKRVIKLTKRMRGFSTNSQCHAIFQELASFAMLKNPMLKINPSQFLDIHDSHGFLLQRLTMEFRKVRRRVNFTRHCKKIAGFGLVISYTAIVIALLVLAVHSMVGIIAAPGLIACFLGLVKKSSKLVRRGLETSSLERLGAQLEVAAKGVFILINDFDTMSRLVRRVEHEIEHSKAIAEMCVRNGRSELLMEVVREFQIHQTGFLEQLEELEEHVYLCFLTINRSRKLVMQEINCGAPART